MHYIYKYNNRNILIECMDQQKTGQPWECRKKSSYRSNTYCGFKTCPQFPCGPYTQCNIAQLSERMNPHYLH